MTRYRPSFRERLWWWWTRQLDRLYIWRRTVEMERKAHASFLRDHPDYAAALKAGDSERAAVILARTAAEHQAGVMATPGFRRFNAAQLRAAGFTEDEIANADQMLGNLDEGGRAN